VSARAHRPACDPTELQQAAGGWRQTTAEGGRCSYDGVDATQRRQLQRLHPAIPAPAFRPEPGGIAAQRGRLRTPGEAFSTTPALTRVWFFWWPGVIGIVLTLDRHAGVGVTLLREKDPGTLEQPADDPSLAALGDLGMPRILPLVLLLMAMCLLGAVAWPAGVRCADRGKSAAAVDPLGPLSVWGIAVGSCSLHGLPLPSSR